MHLFNIAVVLALMMELVESQQVYVTTSGPSARPQCRTCKYTRPQYKQPGISTFTLTDTVRVATSIPPATVTRTYARPYAEVSNLVPNLSTTTWGSWFPNNAARASDTADLYGNAAWTAQWERANPPNFTYAGLYSTTVSPTAVPTSELILPPRDYFGPMDCGYFPKDFIFGVAGSAAQIEGAIAMEGRGPTIMERLIVDDRAKDYVTNENYFLYKQDIERLATLGIKHYSFSLAWTRILPFALPDTPVNQLGIDHYSDLIDFIISKGMIPVATLLHFDTPLVFFNNISQIQDDVQIGYSNGGYQNDTFEDAFVNYAKVALTHFADRVPVWFTFNEPFIYANNAASVDHVIRAHARAYHFYKDQLKATGKMGIKFNDNFGLALNPANASDQAAAIWFNDFQLATFANPIFLGKDYPDSYKQIVPDYVPLTAADLAYMNNTSDFLGIDPYTATLVSDPPGGKEACARNQTSVYYPYCVVQSTINQFGWNIGYRSQSYVYTTPTYLRIYLDYLYNTWKKPILVSEFGFPVFAEAEKITVEDQLFDSPRSVYYLSFMSEILKSIWEDGVMIMGALAWSFADNWEFGDYDARFGLQWVNRTSQERRYKKSLFDLVDFVKARTVSD